MIEAPVLPRFIVGMPRAASTWLMRSLNEHPDVASFGETAYWGRRHVEPNSDGLYARPELRELASVLKSVPFETIIGRQEPGWMKCITQADLPDIVARALDELAPPVDPGERAHIPVEDTQCVVVLHNHDPVILPDHVVPQLGLFHPLAVLLLRVGVHGGPQSKTGGEQAEKGHR